MLNLIFLCMCLGFENYLKHMTNSLNLPVEFYSTHICCAVYLDTMFCTEMQTHSLYDTISFNMKKIFIQIQFKLLILQYTGTLASRDRNEIAEMVKVSLSIV